MLLISGFVVGRYQLNCFNKLRKIGHEDLKPGQKSKLKNTVKPMKTLFVTDTTLAPSVAENCKLKKKTSNPEEPSTSYRHTVLLTNILAGNENPSGLNFQTSWLMDLSNTPAVSLSFQDLGSVPACPMIFYVSMMGLFRYF